MYFPCEFKRKKKTSLNWNTPNERSPGQLSSQVSVFLLLHSLRSSSIYPAIAAFARAVLLSSSGQRLIEKVCLTFNSSKSSTAVGQSKCTTVAFNFYYSQVSVSEPNTLIECVPGLPKFSYQAAQGRHAIKIAIKKIYSGTLMNPCRILSRDSPCQIL